MTRSLYKPDFISKDILRKLKNRKAIETIETDTIEPFVIKTRSRNTVINSNMIGIEFAVYNGHRYRTIKIERTEMIGHRLGEFCFTKEMGNYRHKRAHFARVAKKKQKLLAQKQSKKKPKAKKK